MNEYYPVIVIGGGHAGTEAALASARLNIKTLLVTHNIETLGQMSCNPSIGGIGKSHLVKEIDALGGAMAKAIDNSTIHIRTLNASKGPAVRATRSQACRTLYKQNIRYILENQKNLSIFQQAVSDLIIENNTVIGVKTETDIIFNAETVIITTGTFLNGRIYIGYSNYKAGRAGDPPTTLLAQKLISYNFEVDRLKTGTPPRIDGKSIDFSKITEQLSEPNTANFSFYNAGKNNIRPQQIKCYITHTNEITHNIINKNIEKSARSNFALDSNSPRYCPSIEDKITRFSDRNSHQIFLEPEGLNTNEFYPNGISTSLEFSIQQEFVNSIKGLEKAHITRPGYMIEYDFFNPCNLKQSLETKTVKNLFFAGQINGTTGYEEAAAQGIIAGINAALKIQKKTPWTPKRDEAYIGVMIDDLTTKGVKEPYRMFTSRAEYRLWLREDNADLRLMPQAYKLGLIDKTTFDNYKSKYLIVQKEKQKLKTIWLQKTDKKAQKILNITFDKEQNLANLLKRPDITYKILTKLPQMANHITRKDIYEQLENQIKYEGYIKRQKLEIIKNSYNENICIPENFDYLKIKSLSKETTEKLIKHRPETLGQASRIEGITPSAISILLIYIKKNSKKK